MQRRWLVRISPERVVPVVRRRWSKGANAGGNRTDDREFGRPAEFPGRYDHHGAPLATDAVFERLGDAPDAADVAAVEIGGETEFGVVGHLDGLRLAQGCRLRTARGKRT